MEAARAAASCDLWAVREPQAAKGLRRCAAQKRKEARAHLADFLGDDPEKVGA